MFPVQKYIMKSDNPDCIVILAVTKWCHSLNINYSIKGRNKIIEVPLNIQQVIFRFLKIDKPPLD